MSGANLVFHIAAAFLVVFLLACILKLQRQYDFIQRLLIRSIGDARGGTLIDQPMNFLKKFCEALKIECSISDAAEARLRSSASPALINAQALLHLHLNHRIVQMALDLNSDQDMVLTLKTAIPPPDSGKKPETLNLGEHLLILNLTSESP